MTRHSEFQTAASTATARAPAIPVVHVAGDPILDVWMHGKPAKLAREAPVPVLEETGETPIAGGAAGVALRAAETGASVCLFGVVGDDSAGRRLLSMLDAAGVDTRGVVVSSSAHTTVKRRVIGGGQVIVRLDTAAAQPTRHDLDELASRIALGPSPDVLVVSDYRHGSLAGPVRERLIDLAHHTVTVVDAHRPAEWASTRARLIVPNAAEAAEASGLGDTYARGAGRAERWASPGAAERLYRATGAKACVVTLDVDGSVLLRRDGTIAHRTRAAPVPDSHACGAGDAYTAAAAVALGRGGELADALDSAQAAADAMMRDAPVIAAGAHREGAATATTDDGDARRSSSSERDTSVSPAATVARAPASPEAPRTALGADTVIDRLRCRRERGETIVFTNGCFDLLHVGHAACLFEAKALGDVLVVGLNSDASVRRLKGQDRPVNTASDRAELLLALSCVDYVTIFDDDSPLDLIERIRPDVYAKGGDYTAHMLPEYDAVMASGGHVHTVGYVPDRSTTGMVARIRTGAPAGGARRAAS